MGFILVPAKQPLVPIAIRSYPNESEPGPFPIPADSQIENWPLDHRSFATAWDSLPKRFVIVTMISWLQNIPENF